MIISDTILGNTDTARPSCRKLTFEPTPFAEARAQLAGDGRPPALVEALIGSAERRPRSELVTTTVQELTGRPAGTFRVWADRNAAAFS